MKPKVVFLVCLCAIILFIVSCSDSPETVSVLREIKYIELEEKVRLLNEHEKNKYWLYLIDVGQNSNFNAGHIEYAVNVEMSSFCDKQGNIINSGNTIKNQIDNKWPVVVYSSSDESDAYICAKAIHLLGYSEVYYYSGGITDWQITHGDYLCINYNAFKQWHVEFYPFANNNNFLIDVNPQEWYCGNDVLEGHIPGAVNIPIEELVINFENDLFIVNEGVSLTAVVPDKTSKIIVYNVGRLCTRSAHFIWAAKELGYNNLYRFRIGYDEWKKYGNALINGNEPF